MRLFSRASSNEYNEKLENILENKKVDSITKNLLLSMLYRIENSYEDYAIVKSNVFTKEQFIERILSIIEEKCKEIMVVTPEKEESKLLRKLKQNCFIDVSKGKILVYANEKDLLYAIYMFDIQYNQYYKNKEYNLDKASEEEIIQYQAIQNFFAEGTAMHESEAIRDFSGWSWSTSAKEVENLSINLLYQNILMLIGPDTRNEILTPSIKKNHFSALEANMQDLRKYNQIQEEDKNKKDPSEYQQIIQKAFQKIDDSGDTEDIVKDINLAMLAIEIQKDKEKKQKILTKLKEEKKNVLMMQDTQQYIQFLKNIQLAEEKKIKKIDQLMTHKILLEREYYRRNADLPNEQKIFSVSHLVKMLQKEKKQCEKEQNNAKALMNPSKYKAKQADCQKKVQQMEELIKVSNHIDLLLITIQLEFIKLFMKMIKKANKKDKLIDILYSLRYYCLLPLDEERQIKDIPELQEPIQEMINELLDKCIEKKVIENISNSISLCYSILKYLFETRTTRLENLVVKVTKDHEEVIEINSKNEKSKLYYITIDFFDGVEQVETHTAVVDNLKLLNIKLKRKTPLFI